MSENRLNCDKLFERYKKSMYGSYIKYVNRSYIRSNTFSPGSSDERQESMGCTLFEPLASIISNQKPKWCLEYSTKSTKDYSVEYSIKNAVIITTNETTYGCEDDVYYSTKYILKKSFVYFNLPYYNIILNI
jgi:hypothetical protein